MDKPLSELPVLVLDCQTTGPNPEKGRLLELAWARLPGRGGPELRARLIAQPDGAELPQRITKLTGITQDGLRDAIPAGRAWVELLTDAAGLGDPPWPIVIHFARFERPFLLQLQEVCPRPPRLENALFFEAHPQCRRACARRASEPSFIRGSVSDKHVLPFRLICTWEIARRLLPGLPSRSLRAVAGFLGHPLGPLKRAGEHVRATALVWQELIERLATRRGVETAADLQAWLAAEAPRRTERKSFRLFRAQRRSLPARPGVYRLLGADGRVLYAGKAASLRDRLGAHFTSLENAPRKNLELYSQVWDLAAEPTDSALEAALLEVETIQAERPPYNTALLSADARVWYASAGLASVRSAPDADHRLGPLPGHGLDGPPDQLARMVRRGLWLTRLSEAELVFQTRFGIYRRVSVAAGRVSAGGPAAALTDLPRPAGARRGRLERQAAFDRAMYDRLRVLTTELKRLAAEHRPLALRLGERLVLDSVRLARALALV